MTATPGNPHIGLVVEGPGDTRALPLLLRMHLNAKNDFREILGKPVAVNGKSKATARGGLEGFVATASFRPGCRGVLVVLDSDDDCPATLGRELHDRLVGSVRCSFRIVLAVCDFEDWLYASAETLELGISYREGANGGNMIESALRPRTYAKPTWQPRLTARMNLETARERNSSLSRMLDRFDELCLDI